jgi:lysophospholipase L1-like esterase
VLIDGASTQILSINRARTTYTLAQGLGAGDHTVELIKLTEANVGISQFMGFEFPGGALLAPPPVAVRHLEFLGDSASNGFGIEGARPCAFSSATENARKAYPALVAADLNADHHNLSASGVGVYWNYTRADPDVVSQIYTRSLPFTGTSVFNFGDYTPDVVWVTLGGNDYSIPNPGDPPPPFASFKAQYDALLSQVRTRRPNAFIVGAVAPSITDDYPQGYSAYTNIRNAVSQVVAAKTLAGDAKIAMFEFTRSVDAADLTGCLSHPNVTKHRALANEAVAFLKTKLGW